MTTIAVEPLVLKDYALKIDADNYEKAVSGVLFTPPSESTVTWQGPIGEDHSDAAGSGGWTARIDYVQDWETPDSLSRYLHENAGEEVAAQFVPKKGTGMPVFNVDIVLAAGPIGGTTRQYATASVTLACKQKPVLGATV
ncbi:hypothetical protein ICW40_01160 [Actinotalea ferrariae]|uniref:hypothetical protein n=1 Tax=Actinotalea ferrariae TaxID=1386098 RepID=UPI001C8C3F1B|nr:hypothetical protein [Actinotalea ferrariae]MBX9243414.1 hypothetical protein [Actinotalea ferrariae]